jgi:hypothetical protein
LKRRGVPCGRLVVSKKRGQEVIMQRLHEEMGHRGVEETYRRCLVRFWWPEMKEDVRSWVKSCEACQKRSPRTQKEKGHATGENTLFGRVSLDAVHIKAGRYKYLIVARDDLSGWVEAKALATLTAKAVADFILKEWVWRYGAVKCFTVDGGPEFKGELREAVKMVGSKLGESTPYWPQGEGMVERGHQEIKGPLVKMCGEDGKKWAEKLPLVLFADRISTKRTTGTSPYELLFNQRAILPVDVEVGTFLGVEWDKVTTREELLMARVEQLEQKEEMVERAYERMMKARTDGVTYWDEKNAHRLRAPLAAGDLVLVYNKSLESQWGKLFKERWNGTYRVTEQHPGGSYVLEELDGTVMSRRVAAEHVKRFFPRGVTRVSRQDEFVEESEGSVGSG